MTAPRSVSDEGEIGVAFKHLPPHPQIAAEEVLEATAMLEPAGAR